MKLCYDLRIFAFHPKVFLAVKEERRKIDEMTYFEAITFSPFICFFSGLFFDIIMTSLKEFHEHL